MTSTPNWPELMKLGDEQAKEQVRVKSDEYRTADKVATSMRNFRESANWNVPFIRQPRTPDESWTLWIPPVGPESFGQDGSPTTPYGYTFHATLEAANSYLQGVVWQILGGMPEEESEPGAMGESYEPKGFVVTYTSMVIEADSEDEAIERAGDMSGGGHWEAEEVKL